MQRTLIEIGASVGASAIMLAATIVGGRLVMAQVPPAPSERPASASCDERPLAGVNGSAAHGVSHLCLTMDGADPTMELTGLPVGAVYSAWVAYVDRPSIVRAGECSTPDLAARDQIGAPGRLASDGGGEEPLSDFETACGGKNAHFRELVRVRSTLVEGTGANDARIRRLGEENDSTRVEDSRAWVL